MFSLSAEGNLLKLYDVEASHLLKTLSGADFLFFGGRGEGVILLLVACQSGPFNPDFWLSTQSHFYRP